MEGSPYRNFFISRGRGAVLGTRPGVLRSGEPGFLLVGILGTGVPSTRDPEAGMLPGVWRNSIPEYFSPTVLVVVLLRKAEDGPCENQNILGSQGTPGPYQAPDLKRNPTVLQCEVPKIKKKLGPLCSLRHIAVIIASGTSGFQSKISGSKEETSGVHRGHYIPKNLWVPMRPQGPNTVSGSEGESCILTTLGSNYDLRIYQRISGFLYRLRAPVMIPSSKEGPPCPEYDLRIQREHPGSSTTSGSPGDPRVLTQPPGYEISLQTLRVHTLARNLRVYSPSP
ncbi:hypothetical protein F2Q69_00012589 [Brassica cretica]|uniref:Uncharacterized protein n=1 Tax=Brassica cretica TaxID=69181 RepID=A0A8S9QL30_BRACR|nr:hypothetical protein F2Q69_00012589 [Brassica cretica]